MCVVGLLGGLGLCLIVVVAGVDVLVCGSFLLPASTTTNRKQKLCKKSTDQNGFKRIKK